MPLARTLLERGKPVRAVIRNAAKGEPWAQLGCEIAVADMKDAAALAEAFHGADGVFILPPPEFDPSPGFPEALAVIEAVKGALKTARPQQRRMSVDHRRAGDAAQSPDAANADGEGA